MQATVRGTRAEQKGKADAFCGPTASPELLSDRPWTFKRANS